MKIGDIQGNGYEPNLGLSLQGLESYRKAMDIIDGLLASGHTDLETRRLKAHAWLGTGLLQHSAQRPAEAFSTLTSALAYADTLPPPADIDRYLMRAVLSMSYIYSEWRGEIGPSEAYARKLIEMARSVRDATGSDDAHYWYGVAMTRAGQQRLDAADPDGGCKLLEEGQKEYDELYRRRPDDARFVRERAYGLEILAGCSGGVANVEIWRPHHGDVARAESLLREAFPLGESIARDPRDAQGMTVLADILADRASLIAETDPTTSVALFEQARSKWFGLPDGARDNTWSTTLHWFLSCGFSEPLARLGHRDRALEHAKQGLAAAERLATAADASALFKIHLQMCRYQVATAHHVLGDRTAAIELSRRSLDDLERLIRAKTTLASAYIGTTAVVDRLVAWKADDACALRTRARAAWESWPGARTPYIERELARLATCR
jgi:tetratricopeptide (TPR) repeat protein